MKFMSSDIDYADRYNSLPVEFHDKLLPKKNRVIMLSKKKDYFLVNNQILEFGHGFF